MDLHGGRPEAAGRARAEGHCLGRLSLDRELLQWIRDALSYPHVELVPLAPAVVATAHQLRGVLAGDPGDRIIVATAMVEGAKLVTKDGNITESEIVPVVW